MKWEEARTMVRAFLFRAQSNEERPYAASVFSTSLIQYEVP